MFRMCPHTFTHVQRQAGGLQECPAVPSKLLRNAPLACVSAQHATTLSLMGLPTKQMFLSV